MADLIDRTELRKALRDNGLYSTAVRLVIEAAPAVEDDATVLIKEMQTDLVRVAKLNESLRLANSVLLKENQELKLMIAKESGASNV